MPSNLKNPLIEIYGENALEESFEEIQELKQNSNIPFDSDYIKMGISFMMSKASDILEGKKTRTKLSSLVGESFGEAAICRYNS